MRLTQLLPVAAVALGSSAGAQQELFKLTASDGAAGDYFGYSVSISGDRAIVGARFNDDDGTNSGSAYIFDVTTGVQLHMLTASGAGSSDEFGCGVSVSGDRAIVGAWADDDNGSNSGSAFVFDMATGMEIFKLTASDGTAGDSFGYGVSISGDRAVIGAGLDDDNGNLSGSAYVFDVTSGQQLLKLVASDVAVNDRFGECVAISGNRAVIGSWGDDDHGVHSGSAYIFDITTGQELFKLTASDGAASDLFGYSVSISGNRAVIGARGDDNDNGTNSGSAYLFDVTTGQELFKMTASNATAFDEFGYSVSISGDRVIVGARIGVAGGWSGSAYVFDVTTGQELSILTASDGAAGDNFGCSVSISGDRAAIGACLDDDNGQSSGSAYLFDTLVDCNSNGVPDSDDIANGTSPDVNGNGVPDECECFDPTNYCTANPNSAGAGALIGSSGLPSIVVNDLTLLAGDAPPGQFAIFYYGNTQTNQPFGEGVRCVGGLTFRLNPPVVIDGNGDAVRQLDLTQPPANGGSGEITAGSTWYFQLWYRDPQGGPAGFNFSDGLEVTFCP